MFGLVNIGGSCYLNTVVQILAHIHCFNEKVNKYSGDDRITNILRSIFGEMNKGTASVLSLRNALNIPPGAEDAGNSLATLLDILPTEIIEDFRMSDLNCLIFTTNVGKDFLSTLSLYHVSSYPKILIIDTGHTGTVCKYTIPLSFENNEGISYKLIGLGIYTGGHYYALCKTLDKWVKYNDSSYSLIKSPEIPSGSIPKIIVFEKC